MKRESWSDVLNLFEKSPEICDTNPTLLQCGARALANLGDHQRAIVLCRQSMDLNATDKHVHLILGLVLQETKNLREAETAFRRALFLDRDFMECHFHLGQLLMSENRKTAGLKSLRKALDLAERGAENWLVHHAPDLTFDRFAAQLRTELSHLGDGGLQP